MPIPEVDDAVVVDIVLVVSVLADDVFARTGGGHEVESVVVVIMDECDGVSLVISGVFGIIPPE